MDRPGLTFFCELDSATLQALFADATVLDELRVLGAGVSMGLVDLTPERAAVARCLAEAGVPTVAWLLLPPEEGYWFNLDNAAQAAARYTAFLAWTREHGLRWAGVGLDIEPDLRDLKRLLGGQAHRLLPSVPGRLLNGRRVRRAREAYRALVERIRADGYRVDSYQLPFIVDERAAGSTLLQRLTGVVELPVDREVLMLYTSVARSLGAALLWSYAPEARFIAVGSTGGGVELPEGAELPLLSWEELSRDLRLARRWTNELHVFSLEGCVRQGFLSRLRELDWDAPVAAPVAQAHRVDVLRRSARRVLEASHRPSRLPGGVVGLGVLLLSLGRLGLARR